MQQPVLVDAGALRGELDTSSEETSMSRSLSLAMFRVMTDVVPQRTHLKSLVYWASYVGLAQTLSRGRAHG